MKIGLTTMLFVRDSAEDAVRKAAAFGAECLEVIYDLPHFQPGHDRRKLAGMRELLDSYGLGVSVHSGFLDLNPASHYRELLDLTIRQTVESMEACRALGGGITVVHFGRCPISELGWLREGTERAFREFLAGCLPRARDLGVTPALETSDGRRHFYPATTQELKRLVEESEGAKVAFDVGHVHLAARRGAEASVAGSIRELRDHIVHVHVHDNHGAFDDHLPPGDGEIDFGPAAEALREINYSGMITVELWDPMRPDDAGRRGMARAREIFGQPGGLFKERTTKLR